MKTCIKCSVQKDISEFYKHPSTLDGHLSKCKTCQREYYNNYRYQNPEKIRKTEKKRSQKPHRILSRLKKNSNFREKNPEKSKAHSLVASAIRYGTLKKSPCERCGSIKSLAHHDDYSKPLKVTWLCQTHHIQRHRELGWGFIKKITE